MYRIIGADQKEYGPVPVDQLRQWIAQGRIHRQTKVKPEGGADWQMIGDLPEFAAEFATPRSGPMPPPTPGSSGATAAKTSGMAITSLVLGILGLFSCGLTAVVGLILGIVAMGKIKKSEGRMSGNGLAIAGVCVSGFSLLFVIPLMAAMLLPALSKAKQRAQTIACVNNVKQLSIAVRIYAGDHNEKLPAAATWSDLIQNAVGSPKVFQCPADPTQSCAFAYNRKLDGKKTDEVNPQTVMFFESDAGWNATGGPDLFKPHKHSQYRIVVGLADGSVQQLPRSQLNTLRWDP